MKLLAPTELPPLWHDLIINPLMKNLLMNFFPKNVCPPMKSFFNFEKITPPPPPPDLPSTLVGRTHHGY